ncbi:MAG: hypothetical protein R3330_12155, partial [Saprospiraceae bacterium]|nr:hypothetical protein [Saprospiraceae bacterium]
GYAATAFNDLFDESRSIDGRLDRFLYYAEELLRIYRSSDPDARLSAHFQDWPVISLYLSGMYPDMYTLYPGREIFNDYLERLQARPTQVDDLERFFKVMRTTAGFLNKDPGLVEASEPRPPGHLLLAHEFVYFLTDRWLERSP